MQSNRATYRVTRRREVKATGAEGRRWQGDKNSSEKEKIQNIERRE